MSFPSLAHPGLLLGPISKYSSGPGTHVHDSQIYASLAGPVITTPLITSIPSSNHVKSSSSTEPSLPTLSVSRLSSTNTIPQVNSIVICKVIRLQTRQITAEILVVDDEVCADSWTGVVRREDVRGYEKDKVVMGEGFRVGDLVRGVVVCCTYKMFHSSSKDEKVLTAAFSMYR